MYCYSRTSGCLRALALARLQPRKQSGFAVTDRLAELDVRRPVAAHPRLGQPGQADLEELGSVLRRQQHDGRRRRLPGDRATGMRNFRCHFCRPFPNGDQSGAARERHPEWVAASGLRARRLRLGVARLVTWRWPPVTSAHMPRNRK